METPRTTVSDRTQIVGVLLGLLAGMLVVSSCLATGAGQPQIAQPDSAQLTSAQQGRLRIEIEGLERMLADPSLGSRMTLGERGWTSVQFAVFSAGALASQGYTTSVVVARRSGGDQAWVLVEVDLGGLAAWIPVEATPSSGAPQANLGRIPWDGQGRYGESYLTFDRTIELAPNRAPVAVIRLPAAAPEPGEATAFLGLASFDPDGEIVLCIWSVDEVARATVMKTSTFEYVFERKGTHTVTLTVVDNRGARTTTTLDVLVHSVGTGADVPPVTPGCGCGG